MCTHLLPSFFHRLSVFTLAGITISFCSTSSAVVQPQFACASCSVEIGGSATESVSSIPVKLTNIGTSSLRILGLDRKSSRHFSPRDVSFPAVLEPGHSASFHLVFTDSHERSTAKEQVTLATSQGIITAVVNRNERTRSLEELTLSPRSLRFGRVSVGTGVTKGLTIVNKGSDSAVITSLSVKARSSNIFKVTGILMPIQLPPGGSLTFSASFNPKLPGPEAALISLATSSGERLQVIGHGIGVASAKDGSPGTGTSGATGGNSPGGGSQGSPSGSDNPGASTGQTASSGGPPDYTLAETSASVIPIPSSEKFSPPWLAVSAGNEFTGKFGSRAVQYTRVTDANTYQSCNPDVVSGHGFMLTSGSGDEVVFNADDTLLTVHDGGNNPCFFSLDSNSASATFMKTSYLWSQPGQIPVEGTWSQTNKYRWYGWSGPLFRYNFLPCASTAGGFAAPCAPGLLQVYDYVANCDAPVPIYVNAAGIGANDTVFGVHYSAGIQGTGTAVFAYNASTHTCYKYDTQNMTVKSHTGTAGSPGNPSFSGAVNCDGVNGIVTWASGTNFETTTGAWSGGIIVINGTQYVVRMVDSRTSLRVYGPCRAGTDIHYSINPGMLVTGGSMAQDSYYVHNVKMNSNGQWIVVSSQTCVTAQDGACASYPDPAIYFMWHIGTNTVVPCNPINCQGGHWTESADYFLNIPDGRLHYRAFASAATDDNDYGPVTIGMLGSDVHPSNKDDPFGTSLRPVIGSNYAPETEPWSITNPLSNEVLGWQQVHGAPLLRFGHTYNSTHSSNFPTQYAIGAPSSTGRFYGFTTDGEGTLSEGSEVWLMRLQ